ncbi:MAG: MATE family efflux transporter [Acidobacteriota bacterium]
MSDPRLTGGAGASGAASPSILAMSAPLVLSFWMRAAFNFVDTAYAATLGDAAIAAIGLAIPVEFLMIACWVGISNGLTSHLSRAMGAGEGARIEQLLAATWRLITRILMPVFAALATALWLGATHLGLDAHVARMFGVYGGVVLGGSALTGFWSILPDSLVKAHHDTRSTMWAGIWSNVINVVLNTIFLFVFHWGIFGIAFSTVLGRFGGLVYALRRAKRHEDARKASGAPVSSSRDPHPLRSILTLALPSGASYGLMAMESTLINAILATTALATASIAAYSIYYRVVMFALMPMIAVSVAALPFTARHFGRGDLDAIRHGWRTVSVAAAAYTLLIVGPACWFGGPPLAHLLAEEPTTAALAAFALRIVPVACLVSIPFFLCRPTFEGIQRGRPGLVMAVLRYVILTAPMAYGGARLAERWGFPALDGLLCGLIVASALTSVVFQAWMMVSLRALDRSPADASPAAAPRHSPV